MVEFEYRTIEIIPSVQQKGKKKESLRDLWDSNRMSLIVSERRERMKYQEHFFEEITARNFFQVGEIQKSTDIRSSANLRQEKKINA